jgi:hypothetical protein
MSSAGTEMEAPHVESLTHFPFRDFHEFRAAYAAGIVSPFVSRSVACRWARLGPYSSRLLNIEAWILGSLPHLTLLALVLYAAIRRPFLLFAAPFLVIAYFLFNPTMVRVLRIFAWGVLILVLCLFVWAIAQGRSKVAIVTGAVLVIWYSQRLLHSKAVRGLGRAVTEHEDLLCFLWSTRVVGIAYPNGDIFWTDRKYQDGQHSEY